MHSHPTTLSTQLVSFGFSLTLETDICISGGSFTDIFFRAAHISISGGTFVDTRSNGNFPLLSIFGATLIIFLHVLLSIL
jgi:hypothetical protein